jgi:hypothetical protein
MMTQCQAIFDSANGQDKAGSYGNQKAWKMLTVAKSYMIPRLIFAALHKWSNWIQLDFKFDVHMLQTDNLAILTPKYYPKCCGTIS